MLIGSVQNLNTRSLRSQNGFLRSPRRRPVAACAPARNELSFVLKKGLAATTSRSAQASAESFKQAPWVDTLSAKPAGRLVSGLMGTGSLALSPRIRWPWCYPVFCLPGLLSSLSRPSKSPHDRCWPLKARPRHRHWLIIDLVLGKIGRRRRSWERIARKVQHGRDLHVPWNIGTNWNIEEEKFHNFIDGKAEEEGRS